MKSATQAVIWENWKTCRREVALSMAGSVGIVLLLRGLIAAASKDGGLAVVRGLVTLIIMVSSMCSMFWMRELSSEGHAYTFRLGFTRPISTTRLVLIRLGYAVVSAVLCFLVPNAIFMAFTGYMPLLVPSLLVGTAVTCLVAATWIPTTTVEKMFAIVLVFSGVAAFLVQFHLQSDATDPYVLAIGKPGYFSLGWEHVVALLGTMIVAATLTVVAVDRQRHGGDVSLLGIAFSLLPRFTKFGSGTTTAFSTSTHAQLWFEFRRCGTRVLAMAFIAPICVYVMARWALWMHGWNASADQTAWEGAPMLWLLALIIGPMVYQLIGVDAVLGLRTRENVVRFSAFDGTRAMSSERLVMIKMFVTGACSLVGWIWMWIAAVLYAVAGEDGTVWPRIVKASEQLGDMPGGWWLGAAVCLLMGFVSLTGMLMAFGLWLPKYARQFAMLFSVGYAHIGLALVGNHLDWNLKPFWNAYGYVFAAGIVVISIYAIFCALSDGSVSRRVFTFAFCFWVGFVVCCVTLASKAGPIELVPTVALTIAAAGLFVPLAATVCAPMAMNSWRHQA
jgi:hypothetical protein